MQVNAERMIGMEGMRIEVVIRERGSRANQMGFLIQFVGLDV